MPTVMIAPDRLYTYLDTPIGPLLLVGRPALLTGLYVAGHDHAPPAVEAWKRDDDAFDDAARQLGEYFAGTRTAFDLDLEMDGTPFQQEVWAALGQIPYAETISYRELAEAVGRPSAFRAVGSANGRNPVSIIVPCHRVIAADGTLGGYGWGLPLKQRLLDHERGNSLDLKFA